MNNTQLPPLKISELLKEQGISRQLVKSLLNLLIESCNDEVRQERIVRLSFNDPKCLEEYLQEVEFIKNILAETSEKLSENNVMP